MEGGWVESVLIWSKKIMFGGERKKKKNNEMKDAYDECYIGISVAIYTEDVENSIGSGMHK